MSVGSSVSLAWAIQVETVPLIFAATSHSSFLHTTRFFSLLALRKRHDTLAFLHSTGPPRPNIGSCPLELIDLIVSHVFEALTWEARQQVVDAVGLCLHFADHADELEPDHVCGLEVGCYGWSECCELNDAASHEVVLLDDFYERQDAFKQRLEGEYAKAISKALSHYSLQLISVPSSFPYQDPFAPLDRTVIGIPYLPADQQEQKRHVGEAPKLSELNPTEGNDELVAVVPLPGVPEITDEEKDRFSRARKGLRLVFGDKAEAVWARRKVDEGRAKAEELDVEEEEPRLMIVHSGWCSY